MDFKNKNLTTKQKIGNLGEIYAGKWLEKNGFKIIVRNYRKKWGEIDIIVTKKDSLHFIEVKTVTRKESIQSNTNDDYEPEDNVHPWKIKRLCRTIESYLSEKGIDEDVDWSLDLVTVYLDTKQKILKIDYLAGIF